jgi:general secretion pathway protein L
VSGELLLFLGRGGGFDGWMRLDDGIVAARGSGLDGAEAHRNAPAVLVVPGEAVALRWIELPAGLSEAQAAGAARMMAAELSAQPVSELHVAVGRDESEAEGRRCVGLVPAETMRAWLDEAREAGFAVERAVPETLLISPPEEGVAAAGSGALGLYRARGEAFAMEPGVAALLLGERPVLELDSAAWESGLSEALERAPLDLRQGPFGRRRSWKVEGNRLRRLALMVAVLLLSSLAVQVATIARYSFAADAADEETRRIAATALPRYAGEPGPSALRARLSELRGGGAGFTATAAVLFDAVKATPNAEISGLSFMPDGALHATVQSDSPASIQAVGQRVEAAGFRAETAVPRAAGGRRIAEMTVRAR